MIFSSCIYHLLFRPPSCFHSYVHTSVAPVPGLVLQTHFIVNQPGTGATYTCSLPVFLSFTMLTICLYLYIIATTAVVPVVVPVVVRVVVRVVFQLLKSVPSLAPSFP